MRVRAIHIALFLFFLLASNGLRSGGIAVDVPTPDASETVSGKVELATQAETDAGTDTVKVITPNTLSNYSGLGGGGETNTGSNAGGAGVGTFDGKVGVDLEHRNLVAASSKISVALDAGNKEIDLDAVEANFTLDNIGGTLGIAKGGTGQTGATAAFDALSPLTTLSDLLYHDGLNNARLPIGLTDDHVLTVDSGQDAGMIWKAVSVAAGDISGTIGISQGGTGQTAANAAFNALAPTTTKGDLIVSNGTANARQAVGTDGQVLTADSAQSDGVKWATPSSSITNFEVLTGGSTTTTSGPTAYADMTGTEHTDPGAGDYLLIFHTELDHDTNNATIDIRFERNTTPLGNIFTWRRGSGQGDIRTPIVMVYKFTLTTATDDVRIEWRTSGGTASAYVRHSYLLKL